MLLKNCTHILQDSAGVGLRTRSNRELELNHHKRPGSLESALECGPKRTHLAEMATMLRLEAFFVLVRFGDVYRLFGTNAIPLITRTLITTIQTYRTRTKGAYLCEV